MKREPWGAVLLLRTMRCSARVVAAARRGGVKRHDARGNHPLVSMFISCLLRAC